MDPWMIVAKVLISLWLMPLGILAVMLFWHLVTDRGRDDQDNERNRPTKNRLQNCRPAPSRCRTR